MKMSVRISYTKQFFMMIIFLLIIILGIEGLARIQEYFDPNNCRLVNNEVYRNTNYFHVRQICTDLTELWFEERPFLLLKPVQHYPTININSYGFRGPEINPEKPEDTFRILVVGGSTTFGHGSQSDDTTIPGFLQKKFNEIEIGMNIEIINAGVPSADSARESHYIKNELLKFDPDLFIIYDGTNDAYMRRLDLETKLAHEEIWLKKNEEISGFAFKNFPFYRTPFVIHKLLFTNYQDDGIAGDNPFNVDDTPKIISSWKNNWYEICELGNKKGYSTIITVQPIIGFGKKNLTKYEQKWTPNTPWELEGIRVLNGLSDSLDNLDIVCDKTADLRNIFENVSEPVYIDRAHMDKFGNEIVANKLFEIVLPIVINKTQ